MQSTPSWARHCRRISAPVRWASLFDVGPGAAAVFDISLLALRSACLTNSPETKKPSVGVGFSPPPDGLWTFRWSVASVGDVYDDPNNDGYDDRADWNADGHGAAFCNLQGTTK